MLAIDDESAVLMKAAAYGSRLAKAYKKMNGLTIRIFHKGLIKIFHKEKSSIFTKLMTEYTITEKYRDTFSFDLCEYCIDKGGDYLKFIEQTLKDFNV